MSLTLVRFRSKDTFRARVIRVVVVRFWGNGWVTVRAEVNSENTNQGLFH